MASMWRRAMVYLGLQDDDEYDEYAYDEYLDDEAQPEPARATGARPTRPEPVGREARPAARESREVRPRAVREPVREPEAPPQTGAVRALPKDNTPEVVPQRPVVKVASSASVHVVEPGGFNDAQELGDHLKADRPVILNLQGLSKDLQRRLIDFSSGLTYAVGGSMSRVADQVFLLTPSNVEVSAEEKERLQARGLYG